MFTKDNNIVEKMVFFSRDSLFTYERAYTEQNRTETWDFECRIRIHRD
jgi:hypothetical protein